MVRCAARKVLLLVAASSWIYCATALRCTASGKDGQYVGEFYGTFPSCTFKGIPYATPPVGKLRFMPTRPVAPMRRKFHATEFGPGCIQKCSLQHPELSCPKNISEDCLTLNVYTPRHVHADSKSGLPVMVFFHGGNYIIGTGGCSLYHGSKWAHEQGVIIVTVNYRLGVFGGLYTKRAGVNGNFQLMDQRESLKWVQRNIEAFGGDPSSVTIYGQSAGGFSVASHLASPKSWPYFRRAIVHSDPLALPTEHESKLKIISDEVVKKLGCDKLNNENDELQCLQSAKADQVLLAQRKSSFPITRGVLHAFMPWTPVVTNDEELPLSPMEAAKRGKLPKGVSIMTGTVANESVQFIWKASPKPLSYDEFVLYIESIFGIIDAGRLFKRFGKPPQQQIENGDVRYFMSDLGTDYIFTCPNKRFGEDASNSNPNAYRYYFNHLLSYNEYFQGEWHPECRGWVCHGSELPLIFGSEYLETTPHHPSPTFEEEVLARQMRTVWGNFAKTGNPNKPSIVPSNTGKAFPEIPPLSSNSDAAIMFQTEGSRLLKGQLGETCRMFDSIGYEKN